MSDLWPWALAAYPRPGVEAACLALQDRHEVNVCYLLWAAWGEAEGHRLDLEAGVALAVRWEQAVAGPLRAARRHLKLAWPHVADAPREAVRGEVKRLELAAERLLLDSLEGLPPRAEPVSLTEAAARWPSPPPPEAVAALNTAITNSGYAGVSEPSA